MSMKYRKKPVVIEAMRWDGSITDADKIEEWSGGVTKCRADGSLRISIFIDTLEGEMRADPLDWIIKGIKGELYPCKPDIFEATYELVDE